ncbi:MAG: hypothetical protein ACLUOF_03185 [Ruminococcus sp.]
MDEIILQLYALENITLPDSLTLSVNLFYRCTGLAMFSLAQTPKHRQPAFMAAPVYRRSSFRYCNDHRESAPNAPTQPRL